MRKVRKEKRHLAKLSVLLSLVAEPMRTEPGSTEDVSPYGLRVRAQRPWKPDTYVTVQSSECLLWARARIAYCQPLRGNTFALGLEFVARSARGV
jgi:hypothetical protein